MLARVPVQIFLKQAGIFRIGLVREVKEVTHERDRAKHSIDQQIPDHLRNQTAGGTFLARAMDDVEAQPA